MCNPAIVAGVSALGALTGGYSQYQAGKSQAAAARQNAAIAEAQSHDAVLRGGEQELTMRRRLAMLRGSQNAAAAAGGVLSTEGSAADVIDSSMREGERDLSVAQMNTARERWGYQAQAVNYRNEAAAAEAAGRNALLGGAISAAVPLLDLIDFGGAKKAGGRGMITPKVSADEWYRRNTDWYSDAMQGANDASVQWTQKKNNYGYRSALRYQDW